MDVVVEVEVMVEMMMMEMMMMMVVVVVVVMRRDELADGGILRGRGVEVYIPMREGWWVVEGGK